MEIKKEEELVLFLRKINKFLESKFLSIFSDDGVDYSSVEGYDQLKNFFEIEYKDISNVKMHKLLYFIYGYFYRKYKKELFDANFHAWKLGSFEKNLYHTGSLKKPIFGELNKEELKYLNELSEFFIKISTWDLVTNNQDTDPWLDNYEKSSTKSSPIPKKDINRYFSNVIVDVKQK